METSASSREKPRCRRADAGRRRRRSEVGERLRCDMPAIVAAPEPDTRPLVRKKVPFVGWEVALPCYGTPRCIIVRMNAPHASLNSRQSKTLARILDDAGSVKSEELESLLLALGFVAVKRGGSRVRWRSEKYGTVQMHWPHKNAHEVPPGMKTRIAKFFRAKGITP